MDGYVHQNKIGFRVKYDPDTDAKESDDKKERHRPVKELWIKEWQSDLGMFALFIFHAFIILCIIIVFVFIDVNEKYYVRCTSTKTIMQ